MRGTVIELRCRSRHDEGDVAPLRPPTYADSCASGEIEIDFMNVNHVRSYTECVLRLHAMLLTFFRTSTLSPSTTTSVDSTQLLCVHSPQTHTHTDTHTHTLSLSLSPKCTHTHKSHTHIFCGHKVVKR
jgi:hypothetical protein